MTEKQHTLGAGGLISNVISTDGQRFLVPVKGNNGIYVANLVRRILIEFDNDESTDHQYSFNDVAFLARSFINYLERDVALIEDSGFAGTYSFSETESPYDVISNDLKEAAAKLVDVAERLSKLPIAVVDRPPEDAAKADEVREAQ